MYVSELKYVMERGKVNVIDLKPGMENVHVVVRVLEASSPKVIRTKAGERTISEALVGDKTGRVKLTLWGQVAGSIKEGQVVEIIGGWTSTFKNAIQLNVGSRGKILSASDELVPPADEIPEASPKFEGEGGGFRRPPRRGGRGRPRSWE